MYGAISGDIVGSTYEWHNVKTEDFELFPAGSRFTDDTVLSVSVAEKLLSEGITRIDAEESYAMWYRQYYRRYPNAGFGQMFSQWAMSDKLNVQRSYGNGASMRVTAIGYARESIEEIKKEVKSSCFYTHNHPEAIKFAQAVAIAVFMARKGSGKDEIKNYLKNKFRFNFVLLDEIRDNYAFDSRSSYSVPPAIEAFFESDSYESAIRKAISIGGDSDTIACIAGGIAEAYYKEIPEYMMNRAMSILDSGLKRTINEFRDKYIV